MLLRTGELHPSTRAKRMRGSFVEGLRYVAGRADLIAVLVMLFIIGTFGLNFPIFISTMAVSAFHADARGYGVLSSVMAVGTVAGAFLSARSERPTITTLPTYWSFAATLVVVGLACLTFVNATNGLMQLSTEPAMRGRVMALRVGIALGAAPLGAPMVGWVADHLGPRWALGVGAASGFAAAGVGAYTLLGRRSRSLA